MNLFDTQIWIQSRTIAMGAIIRMTPAFVWIILLFLTVKVASGYGSDLNDLVNGNEVEIEGTEHPRLFLTHERINEIRELIKIEGSHHYEAFHVLKNKIANGYEVFEMTETNWNYSRSYFAQASAFLYQITGDEVYAEQAFNILVDIHQDPDPDGRLPEEGYGLARATVGLGFALAYDWLYHAWTSEQREYVMEKMLKALDAWEVFEHVNIDTNYGSNWTAVCRGGELILMLVAGEVENRRERYETIIQHLINHMDNGYDELGFTQEGIGYTSYAGIFLLPAVYAAKSVGDSRLYEYARNIQWYKQAMYSGSFISHTMHDDRPNQRLFLMSGVGGPIVNDEGWASLLLNLVPDKHLPYFLWWYDRHMGKNAIPQDKPEHRYDHLRQGTMWALLYYPEDVTAKDPTDVFPKAIMGERDQSVYRNRWKDSDDIMSTIIADASFHSHAWRQSEAGQIGLIGYNSVFIGGPHKERDDEYYSKVLVEGHEGNSTLTGKSVQFEAFDDGGYAVVDGDEQYREWGVHTARRQMLVRFSEANENQAFFAITDRLKSDSTRTYTWNLNYGSHRYDFGLNITTDWDADVSTFTLNNPQNEGKFHAWVILPESAELKTGKSIQIVCESDQADYFVIGWTGRSEPPPIDNIEYGQKAIRVEIGERVFLYNRVTDELVEGEGYGARWLRYEKPQ